MTKNNIKEFVGKMAKTEFVTEWCKTIQGNIWRNECILEYRQTLPDQNEVELDAIKDNIEKDTKTIEFLKSKYEIDNI